MRKALLVVLAVMLVMSMAVPAYAANNPSAKAPVASQTVTAAKPAVVETESKTVVVSTIEEAAAKSEEVKKVVVAAQESLAAAKPEGMKAQYFFFFETGAKTVDNKAEKTSATIRVDNAKKVVVKQFVDGKWVELKTVLNEDGTVTIEGLLDGPVAIFTA